MNITIFGATGNIGTFLTKMALENGDNVTAYVRNPGKIKTVHDNLNIVFGDLKNLAQMEKAIGTADVVISTMGPPVKRGRKSDGTPVSDGLQQIVKIMERLGKKRLVVLATPSLRSDEDRKNLSTIFPGIIARIFLTNAYRDIRKMGPILKGSDLDWTVVRIILPNDKHTTIGYGYTLGDKGAKFSITRENVAAAMYDMAKNGLHVRKMPIVFNR